MKKIMLGILMITAAAYIFAEVDGEVIAVKGKAEVQKNGQWSVPAKGEKLSAGTLISTGFKSELTLKIDGSIIVVKPLTRLKLEEIAKTGDAVSSEVFIDVGSIKADIKPAATKKVSFTVRTPVATASVRGTSGEINSDGVLCGFTGIWTLSNLQGNITSVFAGDSVSVDSMGNITPAHKWAIDNAKSFIPQTIAETEGISASLVETKSSNDEPLRTNNNTENESKNSGINISIGWD